jgi:hypothetical protein
MENGSAEKSNQKRKQKIKASKRNRSSSKRSRSEYRKFLRQNISFIGQNQEVTPGSSEAKSTMATVRFVDRRFPFISSRK